MKKLCCLLFALMLGCLLVLPLQANAETEGIYTYTVSDGQATIIDCESSVSGDIVIPDTLGGYPVTTIGDWAFAWSYTLTSVTIPDSVTTIGDSAFYSCTSLTSVTIPNGVTDIDGDAFSHCDSLNGIWVSENNPNYASDNRGVLFNKDKTVLIQAPGALSGSYTIPDGVTTICDSAFFFCSVTSVTIPEGVTTIAGGTFSFSSVKEVTIPDSVTTIGEYAFSWCGSLTYNYYCGAHYLGNSGNPYHAFMGGDSDAATCIIHRDTKMIAACAFEVCENLTDVYYENTEKQWENVAIGDWNGYLLSATIHFAAAQTGDLDGSGIVNEDDAIYLLQYVLMPDLFPVEQTVDYDGSGEINEDDAIYLLQHVLMPDLFPLEPAAPEASGVMTYAQYMDAELDTPVTVECYVQATESWWNDTVTVYAQDHDGGYFIYEMDCTEADAARLTPGTKIRVSGYKAEWCGEIEIVDSTFEFIEGADTFVAAPLDVTALIGTEELIAHQNKKVVFKGMTIDQIMYKNDEPGDDIYITASKNGVTCNFMVERYLTDPDTEVYKAFAQLESGDVVDLEGFLYWYEGADSRITAVSRVS